MVAHSPAETPKRFIDIPRQSVGSVRSTTSRSNLFDVLGVEHAELIHHHAHLCHDLEHSRERTLAIVKHAQKTGSFTTQFLGPINEGSLVDWLSCKPHTEPKLSQSRLDAEIVHADRNFLKAQHSLRWFNEFLDLVLIAGVYNIVYNLGYQLANKGHWGAAVAVWDAFVIWGSFSAIYIEVSLFWARFAHKVSRTIKLLYYFFGLFTVFMAMYAKGQPKKSIFEVDSRGFLGSYIFSLFSLAGLNFSYYFDTIDDEHAITYLHRRLKVFIFSIVICLPPCFIDNQWLGSLSLFASWLALMVVEAISLRINVDRKPVYGEFIIERLSIFVMIVLGESVLSLVLGGLYTQKADGETTMIIITISSYMTIFALYWMYFANQFENALTNPNMFGSCWYVMLHIPLTYSLLLTGFGFKFLLDTSGDADYEPSVLENDIIHNVMAVSIPCSLILIWLVRATHEDMKPDPSRILSFVVRPLMAATPIIPSLAFKGRFNDYSDQTRVEMICLGILMGLIMFLDKVIFAKESGKWEYWRDLDSFLHHLNSHEHGHDQKHDHDDIPTHHDGENPGLNIELHSMTSHLGGGTRLPEPLKKENMDFKTSMEKYFSNSLNAPRSNSFTFTAPSTYAIEPGTLPKAFRTPEMLNLDFTPTING